MKGLPTWTTRAASPRGLLSLALVLGTLSGYAGRGTLAFFTSSVVSAENRFSGGIVDIAGAFTGSTASVLTNKSFGWTANGASDGLDKAGGTTGTTRDLAVCRNILTGQDVRNQRMAPGNYCVAPLDINNDNTNAIDAWMRIRLVRSTPAGASTDAKTNDAIEALNDRLKFYMHEYTASTAAGGTDVSYANSKLVRDSDCTTTSYKPEWTQTGSAGTFQYVFGTSSGKVLNKTNISYTDSASAARTDGKRTAISTLGEIGKNVGAHPGISAVTVAGGAGAYNADVDNKVLDLAVATEDSTGKTTAYTTVDSVAITAGLTQPASNNGLRLKGGTSAEGAGATTPPTDPAAGAAPTEGNMRTSLGTNFATARNAYNILGNDEVTNPQLVAGTNNTGATTNTVITGGTATSVTPAAAGTGSPNGTQAHGLNAEAEILKGQKRYYCVAIFLPADTDTNFSTVYADATAVGSAAGLGKRLDPATYQSYSAALAADKYNFTNGAYLKEGATGTSTLGLANAAVTAVNGKGDNSAQGGDARYYLVVSAAQKAGRTTAG